MDSPNITYNIIETSTNNSPLDENDIKDILSQFDFEDKQPIFESESSTTSFDELLSMEIDYRDNYTVKDLGNIVDYYQTYHKNKIKKCRKKDDLIQTILMFEQNIDNQVLVYQRKQLWHYVKELKNDKFFSKFIIFNSP